MGTSGASQPAEPEVLPLPLATQGLAAVAWQLPTDASCAEKQIDAVPLLALSLQKHFENRPDKPSVRLPVAKTADNHRAVWLGGGGVGKSRTLGLVVKPFAHTYFGSDGHSAKAVQSRRAEFR